MLILLILTSLTTTVYAWDVDREGYYPYTYLGPKNLYQEDYNPLQPPKLEDKLPQPPKIDNRCNDLQKKLEKLEDLEERIDDIERDRIFQRIAPDFYREVYGY